MVSNVPCVPMAVTEGADCDSEVFGPVLGFRAAVQGIFGNVADPAVFKSGRDDSAVLQCRWRIKILSSGDGDDCISGLESSYTVAGRCGQSIGFAGVSTALL